MISRRKPTSSAVSNSGLVKMICVRAEAPKNLALNVDLPHQHDHRD